jgi:hypothetical protein
LTAYLIRHPETCVGEEMLYRFRKTICFRNPYEGKVTILAEARYKLWINGYFVACGPAKGSRHLRYYDEVNIGPFLRDGDNDILVEVLGLSTADDIEEHDVNLCSVIRSGEVYLYMHGTVADAAGVELIATDDSWECCKETHLSFTKQFFVGMNEHVTPGFGTDLDWVKARKIGARPYVEGDTIPFGEITSAQAAPRPIPMMTYIPHRFSMNNGYYDAKRLMTGYIKLHAKGRGKITLTYGECFVDGDNDTFVKDNRTDTSLHLLGHSDTFVINGELRFESFWFRTFRYVKVETEGSAKVLSLSYAETSYPLSVSPRFDFGSERDNALWDISLRTLRRCMQETYTDCPYYEQLQYCMDTYSQTLYTYMISDDLALAKRAISDYALTWRPGFITEARAPSCRRQYIPGFSLFFIYLMNMYEARSGKTEDIKPYMPVLDGILSWFEGQKNGSGLIRVSGMWDFVDWAQPWKATEGAPITRAGEGITVYSMMYIYALEKGARLQRLVGRGAVAEEYLTRAFEMREAVKAACYDAGKGLYADSERKVSFSQHAQIWAVLSGLVSGVEAKRLLERSMTLEAKAGYAYAYLFFRALEKADCYHLSAPLMEQLYGLLDKGATTIPETPYSDSRSECHAWGAVALYEFTTMILGVKLQDQDTRKIVICPHIDGRKHAFGTAYTRFGAVEVRWQAGERVFEMEIKTPDTAPVEVTVPIGFDEYIIKLNGKLIPPFAVK